jgi:hypothetical protein
MGQLDWSKVGNRPSVEGGSIQEKFPEIFSQPQGFLAEESHGSTPQQPAPESPSPAPNSPVRPASAAAAETPDNTDYANMGWGDVASKAFQAAPASFMKQISSVGEAITNPSQTLSGLSDLGSGLYSKAKGFAGYEQSPEEKANTEGVLDSIVKHYSDVYGGLFSGDTAGLKKELVNDPFSVGMDVAALAPVGGAAVRGVGLGQKAASVASKTASMLDPIQASIAAAKNIAVKPTVAIGKGIAAGTSGVPRGVMDIAQNVGRLTGAEGAEARKVFNQYSTGQGDMTAVSKSALDAVDQLRDASNANYVSKRTNLTTQNLNTNEIMQSLRDARAQLGPDAAIDSPEVVKALDEMERRIVSRTDTTAVGLDNLKRGLNDIVGEWRGTGREGLLAKIPQSVRKTIADADPKYADMMDEWQAWRTELQDLQKELGLGQRTSQSTRLKKMLADMMKDKNKSLLGKIVKTDAGKNIPYMLAGDAVSSYLPRWAQGVGDILLYGGLGTFVHPAAWAGLAGASPKLMGKLAKATGTAERMGSKVSPLFRAPTTTVLNRLNEAQAAAPAPLEGVQQAAGGRIGRKSGGRIGDPGAAAEKLILAAERAKKNQGNATSALLQMPDEAITKALAVANEHI